MPVRPEPRGRWRRFGNACALALTVLLVAMVPPPGAGAQEGPAPTDVPETLVEGRVFGPAAGVSPATNAPAPAPRPEASTVFAEMSVAAGIAADHAVLIATPEASEYTHHRTYPYLITGQAWGDYDRDGWLDLYLTSQIGPNTLYRNQGDGTFAVSALSALGRRPDAGSGGAVFADYDNDGWADLYVTSYGRDTLFHNDRGAGFTDVTARAGITDGGRGMTASWGDYDR